MKLNLQRILIVIIACLGLFFSGCEKEEINTEQKIEIKNKFTDHDYLKTLQEDPFFAGAINDFNNFITYEKSSSSNNFKIVEGSVRIERGVGYTTYVLLIENQINKKNYFENLVIQTALNKPTRYLFVKYDLQKTHNNQFIEDPEHGIYTNMNIRQLNVFSNNSSTVTNKGGCAIIITAFCDWGGTTHVAGSRCQNAYDLQSELCFGGGGDGIDISTGNGNGSSGGTYTPPTVDVPEYGTTTYFPPTMIIDENGDLIFDPYAFDSEQTGFLNGNPLIRTQITNYLLNHITINDRIFIKQVIDKMRQNPGLFTNLNPFLIEKNIDDTQLDQCSKSILNKLKGLQQNDIALIIKKFGNINSNYNINISTQVPSTPNALAGTDWISSTTNPSGISPYNYSMKILPNYKIIGTDLTIASTILHEMVHAYFLSLIDDCHQSNNCSLLQTFPELWNFYVQNQDNGTLTNNISQHNQIANSYVNIIGAALQEFATGVPVIAGQIPQQIYTDLSWAGLEGTIPYNALSQTDKNRIQLRSQVEILNQSSMNQNAVNILPAGNRTGNCQ